MWYRIAKQITDGGQADLDVDTQGLGLQDLSLQDLDLQELDAKPVQDVDPSWIKATDDERSRARFMGVVIPPNSWNVRFNAEGSEPLLKYQDRTGKWQYRYSPQFTKNQSLAKFDKMDLVRRNLPVLDGRVMADLQSGGLDRDRVLAGIIRLMLLTGMRVGSEQYAREHGTYGASSLLKPHVEIDPESKLARINFTGKHHIQHEKNVEDRPLIELFEALKSSTPGERLFQYEDRRGFYPAREGQVNEYLAPHGMTAHNLRTYNATRRAHDILMGLPAPENAREARRNVRQMAEIVSKELGNTPAMALQSYISPAVLNAYESGHLVPFEEQPLRVASSRDLEGEERFHASLDRIQELLEKGIITDEHDPERSWDKED